MSDTIIIEGSRSITLKNGETVVVREFDTEQTLLALGAIFSIVSAIEAAGGELSVPQLLVAAPSAVLQVVAIGVGKTVEEVKRLSPKDTIAAATAIVEVNRPFFVEEVLPELGKAAKVLGAALNAKPSA